MRKYLAIINPKSGTESKTGVASRIVRTLAGKECSVDTYTTKGPGDATRIARWAAVEGYYAVLACGGDGTVNEVATGLVGTQTALGIIPLGSGNGLANHLRIPVDTLAALRVIAKDNVITCDYCTANNRPFFCTFGVGFDAEVSHDFARKPKRGLTNYVRSAISVFQKYRAVEYRITANNRIFSEKAFIVVCCNASQYGNNAYIAPGADICDGLMNLIIVHEGNMLQDLRMGAELAAGLLDTDDHIKSVLTPKVTIESRESSAVDAHIDGEPVKLHYPLDICVHPGQLRILAPTRNQRFIPVLTPFYLNTLNLLLAAKRAIISQ